MMVTDSERFDFLTPSRPLFTLPSVRPFLEQLYTRSDNSVQTSSFQTWLQQTYKWLPGNAEHPSTTAQPKNSYIIYKWLYTYRFIQALQLKALLHIQHSPKTRGHAWGYVSGPGIHQHVWLQGVGWNPKPPEDGCTSWPCQSLWVDQWFLRRVYDHRFITLSLVWISVQK